MILMIPLILLMVPAILLGLNLAITPPTSVDYSNMASQKAASAYYQTGYTPATVNVMGSTVIPGTVDATDLNYQALDNLTWKRINAEQAMLTACNQIMTKCNTSDITLLWSFLPANSGTFQSLLSQTYGQNTLNCGVPSTYAAYGLYVIQQALASQDTTVAVGSRNYALYYNKPSSGIGCYYVDMVTAQ